VNWREFVLTFFGAGKFPKAPGTMGSLGAILLLALIHLIPGLTWLQWNVILLCGCLLSCVGMVTLGPWAVSHYGTKDPQSVVLDEVAAVFLTMLLVPMSADWQGWLMIFVWFVAFRAFDITKPPPCRQLEKLPNGWGILCDDLMAGVYANIVCQAVARFL
jgi:phosphatidylglycerophosphatase A